MPVDQAAFLAATERTVASRCLIAMLALVGPLPVNDDRAQVGLFLGTQPWAAQRGEQDRYDSTTVKALIDARAAFLSGARAVRADFSWVHDAAVLHAPQGRIMLMDRPMHTFPRCHSCTASFTVVHGRVLSRCSSCTVLTHFAKVAKGIQPSHNACVSAITGARESNTGSSSFPAIIRTFVALLPCIRFAKHDATCDRDCCSCVSLSPVTATP